MASSLLSRIVSDCKPDKRSPVRWKRDSSDDALLSVSSGVSANASWRPIRSAPQKVDPAFVKRGQGRSCSAASFRSTRRRHRRLINVERFAHATVSQISGLLRWTPSRSLETYADSRSTVAAENLFLPQDSVSDGRYRRNHRGAQVRIVPGRRVQKYKRIQVRAPPRHFGT